jgi:metal-responsive CopG/Arc/MetJ family transcriptional regulator
VVTVNLGVRIPKEMIPVIEEAMQIVGATSYSDLLRDALRHYLAELSLLSARSEKIKKMTGKVQLASSGFYDREARDEKYGDVMYKSRSLEPVV